MMHTLLHNYMRWSVTMSISKGWQYKVRFGVDKPFIPGSRLHHEGQRSRIFKDTYHAYAAKTNVCSNELP